MNRTAFARLLEAFFRHWYLYLIPVLLLGAVGAVRTSDTTDTYTSSGSVFIGNSPLSGANGGERGTGYLTPSAFVSQELEGLLSTDVFIESVLEQANIAPATLPQERTKQLRKARDSIATFPISENLARVRVKTDDPALSQTIADATIESFLNFKISTDVAEANAAVSFHTELVADYEAAAITATAALDSFLSQIEAANIDALTPAQASESGRLTDANSEAQDRFAAARTDLEDARLTGVQAEADVRQRLSIVDPPNRVSAPDSSFAGNVMKIGTFTLGGALIALAGVSAAAMLSSGVVFDDDITGVVDVDVLATIPRLSKGSLRLESAEVPDRVAVPERVPTRWIPTKAALEDALARGGQPERLKGKHKETPSGRAGA